MDTDTYLLHKKYSKFKKQLKYFYVEFSFCKIMCRISSQLYSIPKPL